jgi:hypothetical protein
MNAILALSQLSYGPGLLPLIWRWHGYKASPILRAGPLRVKRENRPASPSATWGAGRPKKRAIDVVKLTRFFPAR